MSKKTLITLLLILIFLSLAGCESTAEDSFEGATMNGSLTGDSPGSRLDFLIEVENEGDPVGIDFRGTLTRGSVSLQIIDAEDEIYEEWEFHQIGPFSVNTTLYPPAGTYRYGMVWDEPVQLAQYSLTWKPHTIEAHSVTPLALVPGVGMILVALGFMVYAAVRRLGWGYLILGALGWVITVALKFAWAIPVNTTVYETLTGALPEPIAHLIFYVYVGALTGVFEVGIIWLILRFTKLGKASWDRALAFGIGFGAVEALLLGISSLASASVALTAPSTLPLAALEQLALTNNLLYGIAPVWERFFVVIIHIYSNVLLFYGAQNREARWFWLAFIYKTGIDAIAAFAQFWGLDTLGRLWTIEGLIALWGIAGLFGIRRLYKRYPLLDQEIELEPAPVAEEV